MVKIIAQSLLWKNKIIKVMKTEEICIIKKTKKTT